MNGIYTLKKESGQFKEDLEDNDGIADTPPVPSHSKVYGLINSLQLVCKLQQKRGDEAFNKTDTAPRNKLLLLTTTQYILYCADLTGTWLLVI